MQRKFRKALEERSVLYYAIVFFRKWHENQAEKTPFYLTSYALSAIFTVITYSNIHRHRDMWEIGTKRDTHVVL